MTRPSLVFTIFHLRSVGYRSPRCARPILMASAHWPGAPSPVLGPSQADLLVKNPSFPSKFARACSLKNNLSADPCQLWHGIVRTGGTFTCIAKAQSLQTTTPSSMHCRCCRMLLCFARLPDALWCFQMLLWFCQMARQNLVHVHNAPALKRGQTHLACRAPQSRNDALRNYGRGATCSWNTLQQPRE